MYPLDLADPNAPPVLQPSDLCSDNPASAIATFEDAALEAAVRIALFPQDDLACELLSGLTGLNADRRGITSLMGIQNLTGLTGLSLDGNAITDVGPLSGLTNLTGLWLDDNSITDIGPLSGLTSLLGLWLHGNAITDIGALSGLTSLTELDLRDNPNLSNIQPLLSNAGLGATSVVHLSGTRVSCEDVALLEAKRVAVVSTC